MKNICNIYNLIYIFTFEDFKNFPGRHRHDISLTSYNYDILWHNNWQLPGLIINCIYCRLPIFLEDYVICKMPLTKKKADVAVPVVSHGGYFLSLFLPVCFIIFLLMLTVYNLSCTLNCSSYLATSQSAAKHQQQSHVWMLDINLYFWHCCLLN